MWEESVGKVRVKRNRIDKPYVRPQKSLIRRVTDSLTGLLPNPSWLSWMKTSTAPVAEETETSPSPSNRVTTQESFIFRRSSLNVASFSENNDSQSVDRNNAGPSRESEPAPSHDVSIQQDESIISPRDEDSESESTSGCSSLLPHPDHSRKEVRDVRNPLNMDRPSLNNLSNTLSKSLLNVSQQTQVQQTRGWKTLNLGSNTKDVTREETEGDRTFDKASIVSLCSDDDSIASVGASRSSAGPSSKRPRFNITAFGSPLLGGKSTLLNSSVTASPFYAGRTTYGGASAYRKTKLHVATPYASNRRQVKVRPASASSDTSVLLSSTAKKILNALESMSTPVKDAKKIPSAKSVPDETDASFMGFSATRRRPRLGPPATKLPISTPASLVRKPSLLPEKPVPISEEEVSKSGETQISSTPLAPAQGGGKLRARVTAPARPSARAAAAEELLEEPDLPSVSLPISSLPSFQMFAPSPITSAPQLQPFQPPVAPVSKPIFSTPLTATAAPAPVEKQKSVTFAFSSPAAPIPVTAPSSTIAQLSVFRFSAPLITVTPPLNGTSLPPSEKAFTFSSPIPVDRETSEKKAAEVKEKIAGAPSEPEKPKAAETGWGDKFKPAAGTWECDACLVRNPSDKSKCTACETPKPGATGVSTAAPEIKITSGFGDKFKPAAGSWTCAVCSVNNPSDKTHCVACETPKPGAKAPAATSVAAPAATSATSGFGDKFKAAQGSWTCDVCMIPNAADKTICAACENPKPGAAAPAALSFGFGDKFKPSSDTWECGTCMVRNKPDVNKCVACETLRPGAAAPTQAAPKPAFKFGVPATAAAAAAEL